MDLVSGGDQCLLNPRKRTSARTFNGYALFRAISKSESECDVAAAIALVKQMKLYPLSTADNPPSRAT